MQEKLGKISFKQILLTDQLEILMEKNIYEKINPAIYRTVNISYKYIVPYDIYLNLFIKYTHDMIHKYTLFNMHI
jgi:hypothetical protein